MLKKGKGWEWRTMVQHTTHYPVIEGLNPPMTPMTSQSAGLKF